MSFYHKNRVGIDWIGLEYDWIVPSLDSYMTNLFISNEFWNFVKQGPEEALNCYCMGKH